MTKQGSSRSHVSTRRPRRWPLVAVGLVALVAAACGGSSTATPASTVVVVKPPDFTLQGCTYVLDSTIPAGEPQGIKPGFAPFAPDSAATTALEQIRDHGGTAMVDSVAVPTGTKLYAGPSTGEPPAGTVPSGDSIQASEPVVWTDRTGDDWLAFFLSCGGDSLYWASVKGITGQDASAGGQIATQIQQLRHAATYTRTGQASMLPITVNGQKHLVFANPKVAFSVGRGELVGVPL
jgi:hypothetical protein